MEDVSLPLLLTFWHPGATSGAGGSASKQAPYLYNICIRLSIRHLHFVIHEKKVSFTKRKTTVEDTVDALFLGMRIWISPRMRLALFIGISSPDTNVDAECFHFLRERRTNGDNDLCSP